MGALPRHTLAFLGLSEDDERLYRTVLSQSGRSVEEVAGSAETTPDGLRTALHALVELGLVSTYDDRVTARSPTDAITDLVLAELETIRASADRLDEVGEAIPAVRAAFRTPPSASDHPLDGEVKIGGDIPAMLVG